MSETDLMLYTLARKAQGKAISRRRQRLRAAQRVAVDAPVPPGDPQLSPTQKDGLAAENRVRRYLESAGLVVLQQNLRCKVGEIDLVCRDNDNLVFAEVRHRATASHGGAAASVDHPKQQRLIRAAHFYLPRLTQRYFAQKTPRCRFDVIAIEGDEIRWIKNAFGLSPD